jgi:hypothetical protein
MAHKGQACILWVSLAHLVWAERPRDGSEATTGGLATDCL